MDPALQHFLDHLHSVDLSNFAEAVATNNFELVSLALKEVHKPIEEIFHSPEPYILFGMFIIMFIACVYATTASTAANHLTVKDLIEDEKVDTNFINEWLKYADRIRISLYLLQAVALIYMTSVINWFFENCVIRSWVFELLVTLALLAFILVFASLVPWFVGVRLKKVLPIKHFGFLKFVSNLMRPVNGFCLIRFSVFLICIVCGFKDLSIRWSLQQ